MPALEGRPPSQEDVPLTQPEDYCARNGITVQDCSLPPDFLKVSHLQQSSAGGGSGVPNSDEGASAKRRAVLWQGQPLGSSECFSLTCVRNASLVLLHTTSSRPGAVAIHYFRNGTTVLPWAKMGSP